MSNNRFVLDGWEALRAELRNLPPSMVDEASGIVADAARNSESDIRAAYEAHIKAGELSADLTTVIQKGGRAFAGAIVRNTSKLAYIFENGTQVRHSASGASRGSIKPLHVAIPTFIKRRAEMYERLRAMMAAHGLTVIG